MPYVVTDNDPTIVYPGLLFISQTHLKSSFEVSQNWIIFMKIDLVDLDFEMRYFMS